MNKKTAEKIARLFEEAKAKIDMANKMLEEEGYCNIHHEVSVFLYEGTPDGSVEYKTSDDLAEEFGESIKRKDANEFGEEYREFEKYGIRYFSVLKKKEG